MSALAISVQHCTGSCAGQFIRKKREWPAGGGRSKTIFVGDVMVYVENPHPKKIVLKLINCFSEVARHKSTHKNHLYFYELLIQNEQSKTMKLREVQVEVASKTIEEFRINLVKEGKSYTLKVIKHH